MGASAAFLEGNRPINPQVLLGAGFSATAGVPLASQLFDSRPLVDRITRRKLVDRVVVAGSVGVPATEARRRNTWRTFRKQVDETGWMLSGTWVSSSHLRWAECSMSA